MQSLGLHPPPPAAAACMDLQLPPKAAALSIVDDESPERRLLRVVAENPVVVLSRRSCCMCHVMRRLLTAVGAHPTVIELDDSEAEFAPPFLVSSSPALFIGGALVGGVETLMTLHVTGQLVPRLREVGALSCARHVT